MPVYTLVPQMFFRATLFSAFGASKRWLATNPDGTTRQLTSADFFKVCCCCLVASSSGLVSSGSNLLGQLTSTVVFNAWHQHPVGCLHARGLGRALMLHAHCTQMLCSPRSVALLDHVVSNKAECYTCCPLPHPGRLHHRRGGGICGEPHRLLQEPDPGADHPRQVGPRVQA